MGRRKKEEIIENPKEMKEDAMNPPISSEISPEVISENVDKKNLLVFKRVNCPTAFANVRDGENGEVMFTVKTNSKVIVENEANGWSKISGYIMTELLQEL